MNTRPFHKKVCSACGAELTPLERVSGSTCSRFKCRVPVLQEQSRLALEADETRIANTIAKARSEYIDAQYAHLPIVLVPKNSRKLAPLSEERKQAFIESLTKAVTEARQALQSPEYAEKQRKELSEINYPTSGPLAIHACTTCGGKCCNGGETHAFLSTEIIGRKILADPDMQDSDRINSYIAHLPEQSYENSCIFHTETGCVLSRQMRSEICNLFLCKGIKRNLDASLDPSQVETITVQTNDDSEIERIVRSDSTGNRITVYTLPESLPPSPPLI